MRVRTAARRMGFTVTEVVVTMAIIGLLAAIITPAVQSSRESSRKLQCANNLRQLGLAMENFAESSGAFPTSAHPNPGFWRILPYLEQSAISDELKNTGVANNLSVPEFVCPDDILHPVGFGNSNYFFNDGTLFSWNYPRNGFRKSSIEDTTPQDIPDGLSNTAAMSERLVGVPTFEPPPTAVMEQEPRRYFWYTAVRHNGRGEEALAADECRHRRTTTDPQFAGSYIQLYRESGLSYNHILTPNEAACYNGPEDLSIDTTSFLIPPSSMHPKGVNVLFADGSVHFITDGIGDEIWHAIGTRNGNEVETISF